MPEYRDPGKEAVRMEQLQRWLEEKRKKAKQAEQEKSTLSRSDQITAKKFLDTIQQRAERNPVPVVRDTPQMMQAHGGGARAASQPEQQTISEAGTS